MTSQSASRYSPEFREWAVIMLLVQRGEYRSEYAAIAGYYSVARPHEYNGGL
jgi:hypothetical protein